MSLVTYTKWIGKKANGKAADSDYNALELSLAEGDSLIPTGSIITDLSFRVQAYTATYSSSRTFKITNFYVGNSNGPQRASTSDAQNSSSLDANGWQGLEHSLNDCGYTDAYLISNYFNKSTINVAFGLSTSNGADCWINGVQVYIEYTSPVKPTPPTEVTVDDTTPYPEQKLTLSWSGATYTSPNTISSYKIYCNGKFLADASKSPYKGLTASTTNGEAYKYTVKAIGVYSNSSTSTASATATTTVSDPTTITSLSCNELSTIYIGGVFSSLKLTWSGATAGEHNSTITGYNIYKDNELLHTCGVVSEFELTSLNLISYVGVYSIETIAGYTDVPTYSGQSTATIEIKELSFTNNTNTNFFFKTTPGTEVSDLASYSWSQVTANDGVVKYVINCRSKDQDIFTKIIEDTSYSFNVSDTTIQSGTEFTFSVVPIVYSSSEKGGALNGKQITYTSSRVSSFYFPTNFWLEYYNPDYQTSANKAKYGWEKVLLKWAKPQTENTAITNTYTYRLNFLVGNSVYEIASELVDNFYTVDFSKYKVLQEGTDLHFIITATDQYGVSQESSKLDFTILSRPKLSNLSVGSIGEKTIQPKFSYQFTSAAESTLQYKYILTYQNEKYIYSSNEYVVDIGSIFTTVQNDLSVKLTEDYNNEKANPFWKKIYNTVITQQIPQPEIQITVLLASTTFFKEDSGQYFGCYQILNSFFNLNYIDSSFEQKIPTFTLKAVTNPNLNYYNPNDLINCEINSLRWAGLTGTGKGATISYTLTRINFERTFDETNLSYQDTIIQTDTDFLLTYHLQAKLTYENNGKPITLYSQTSQQKVNVARWNELDNIVLTNCKISEIGVNGIIKKGISGQLKLPNLYPCGSTAHSSISTCFCHIKNSFNTQTVDVTILCSENKEDKIDFFIEFEKKNDLYQEPTSTVDISGYFTVTNTSGQKIEKLFNIYQIRLAASTVSFRKNRIGINVNEDFADFEPVVTNVSGTQELVKNEDVSALYINAKLGADYAPVIEVNANTEGTCLMNCLQSGNLISSFQIRNKKALTITNLSTINETKLVVAQWIARDNLYFYRISNTDITKDTFQEILPSSSIKKEELKAYQKANFIGGDQGDGWCEIICFGTKPTIDIPITLIIRGG